jgi:hypothetical protein
MCKEATMSTKKQEQQSTSRTTKRERFTEREGGKPRGASPLILIAGIAVALILIGGTVLALTRPSPTSTEAAAAPGLAGTETDSQIWRVSAATVGHDPYPQVLAEDGVIQLPLSTFDDYKAHHYTYMNMGRPIEFFVLKSKDGVVRAAFNACDVCFGSKKGYTQDGDYMVCNNCGRRFPADQINVVHGGCNPSPLDRTVEGDTLTIQVEDIIAGQDYF